MIELDKLRELFLSPELDPEVVEDNRKKIAEWESELIDNQAFAGWRTNDITLRIAKRATDTYKDQAMFLMLNRHLSDEVCAAAYAKQDACLWLLSLIEVDAQGAIDRIHQEIRAALQAS